MADTVFFTQNNLKILPKPMNTMLTIFTGDCERRQPNLELMLDFYGQMAIIR
jgi:hypothetical protein